MSDCFKWILVLAGIFFLNGARAQIQEQIQKVYQYESEGSFQKMFAVLGELETQRSQSAYADDDSLHLFITSKLAFASNQLLWCDTAIIYGKREIDLRKSMTTAVNMDLLSAMHNQGVYLINCGRFGEARDILMQTLDLHGQFTNTPDQVSVATMDDLAYTFWKTNEPDSAAFYYKKITELLESNGINDGFYVHVIEDYSTMLINYDRFAEAAPMFDVLAEAKKSTNAYAALLKDFRNVFIYTGDYAKALELTEELIAYCSRGDCTALDYTLTEAREDAARLCSSLGRFDDSEKYLLERMKMNEGNPGQVIEILLELSKVSAQKMDRSGQRKWLLQAKRLHEDEGLITKPTYGTTIFDLANVMVLLGERESAESMLQDYLEALENSPSTTIAQLARVHQLLGNEKYLVQDFKGADFHFNRAVKLFDRMKDADQKDYASLLNSYGALSESLGNFTRAKQYYQEALSLLLKQKAPNLEVVLNANLANLLAAHNPDDDSIKILFDKAIAAQASEISMNTPVYANLLIKRGLYQQRKGQFEESRLDYEQAYTILERHQETHMSDFLALMSNMGLLFEEVNQPDSALYWMKTADSGYRETFGKHHPGYLINLNNLANWYASQGKIEEAIPLQLELAAAELEEIDKSFSYLSESEKEKFVREKKKFLESFKEFIVAAVINSETDAELQQKLLLNWYNLELATKGMLLNSTRRVRETIFNSGNPQLIAKFSLWTMARKEIADLRSITSPVSVDLANSTIDSLQTVVNRIEKELSRDNADFDASFSSQRPTFTRVSESLRPGEAAVEVVKIETEAVVIYTALVVYHNQPAPQLLILGEGDDFDNKGYAAYKNAIAFKIPDRLSYDRYWGVLQKEMQQKEVNTIYFAPDGVYHKINLITLYNPERKEFILDEYKLVQVSSSKDIITRNESTLSDSFEFCLIGRPSYSLKQQNETAVQTSRALDLSNIGDLPGTEKEVETIGNLLSARSISHNTLLNELTTEDRVQEELNKEVVHIATHGFFLNDKKMERYGKDPDPMLYSGLLLAGVKDSDIRSKTGHDGILTAYEIMNMDLSNNRMVVLSACETGLGEVSTGEGIYGLQRAFLVAGSETIVMSLWKVDDAATQELMTTFYQKFLENNDRREAFTEAQKELREKYPEPIYWGAFVMVGA
jgi:CHAT domain-containing protein/tetratricopeptide (TPR) repeat protein